MGFSLPGVYCFSDITYSCTYPARHKLQEVMLNSQNVDFKYDYCHVSTIKNEKQNP